MCAPVRGSGEGDARCQHNVRSALNLSLSLAAQFAIYQAPHYVLSLSFSPVEYRRNHTHGVGTASVTLTTDHEYKLVQFI